MTDQFAFLGDTRKAAIVAMSLGILLLLPASLGYGGTIIQEAFGQFNLPLLEDDTEETEEEDEGLVVEDEEITTPSPTPPATTQHPILLQHFQLLPQRTYLTPRPMCLHQ